MATVLRSILTSMHGRLAGLANDGSLIVKGEPDQVVMTPAASSTAICLVTMQVRNNEGEAYKAVLPLTVWLSDSATGDGVTATTPSGALAAGANGTSLGALTASKALKAITNTLGVFILSITDTAKTAFYVCARVDGQRKPGIATKLLATANYGP